MRVSVETGVLAPEVSPEVLRARRALIATGALSGAALAVA